MTPPPSPSKRIMPVNRPNKGTPRFQRLKNAKCFKDMRDRMLAGWPAEQLARFIQVDNKEMTDLKEDSLAEQLRDYRKTIPPSDFISDTPPSDMIQQRMRPYHEKAIKAFSQGLNELSELERLYRLQMDRIEIDSQVEKKQKKLIPSMTQEMRIAKELLESSSKMKMDLGLRKRHLGVMETEARLIKDVGQKYGDERVTTALKDSRSRQRLAGVVASFERFMLTDGKNSARGASILDELAEVLPEDAPQPEPVTMEQAAGEEELEKDLESELPEHPSESGDDYGAEFDQ